MPVNLTAQYGRSPQAVVESGAIYYTWLIPATLAAIVWIWCREYRAICCGAIVFAFGLLPVLGLTPFMFQLNSTVADHYVYLAMLGPAIALASGQKVIRALSIPVLLALMVLSIRQQRHWKDSIAMFAQAVRVNPNSSTAQGYLGMALATAGRADEAIPHFRTAIQAQANSPVAWIYLAHALEQSGQPADAYQTMIQAMQRFPNDNGIALELDNLRRRLDSAATKPETN